MKRVRSMSGSTARSLARSTSSRISGDSTSFGRRASRRGVGVGVGAGGAKGAMATFSDEHKEENTAWTVDYGWHGAGVVMDALPAERDLDDAQYVGLYRPPPMRKPRRASAEEDEARSASSHIMSVGRRDDGVRPGSSSTNGGITISAPATAGGGRRMTFTLGAETETKDTDEGVGDDHSMKVAGKSHTDKSKTHDDSETVDYATTVVSSDSSEHADSDVPPTRFRRRDGMRCRENIARYWWKRAEDRERVIENTRNGWDEADPTVGGQSTADLEAELKAMLGEEKEHERAGTSGPAAAKSHDQKFAKFDYEERARNPCGSHPMYDPLLASSMDANPRTMRSVSSSVFNYVVVQVTEHKPAMEEAAQKLHDGGRTTDVTADSPRTAAAKEAEKRAARAASRMRRGKAESVKSNDSESEEEEEVHAIVAPTAEDILRSHIDGRPTRTPPSLPPSAAADMIRLAKVGVRDRVIPGETPRRWNEEWQRLVELPVYDDLTIDRRSVAMDSLWHEFSAAIAPIAKRIVRELTMPRSKQTVKHVVVPPAVPGNPTQQEQRQAIDDQHKFLYRGIFFQVVDNSSHLYGSVGFDAKCAGHELRALRWIASCDLPLLHFPLMAIADYQGWRVVATALLPVWDRKPRLWIGSNDGGVSQVTPTGESRKVAEQLSTLLNLKNHSVGLAGKAVETTLPADALGLVGDDGRRYLTNLRRLFPSSPAIGLASSLGRIVPFDETSPIRLIPAPQMPDDFGPEQDRPPKHIERCVQAAIGEPGMNGGVIIRPEGTAVFFKGGGKNLYNQRASIAANETVFGDAVILESYLQERPHLWYRLRPELLLSRKSPISSDVFDRLGEHNYRKHNRDAIQAAERLISDELLSLVDELEGQVTLLRKPESWSSPCCYFNQLFHRRGINLRHMGRARALTADAMLQEFLLVEIMARTTSWVLNKSLRVHKGTPEFDNLVVNHLNNMMGYLVAEDMLDDDDGTPRPEVEQPTSSAGTAAAAGNAGPAGFAAAASSGLVGSLMANIVNSAAMFTENEHQIHFKAALWLRFEHCLSPEELGATCSIWSTISGPSRQLVFRRIQILTGIKLGIHVDGNSPIQRKDVFDELDIRLKAVGPVLLQHTYPRKYMRGECGEKCEVQTYGERRAFLIDAAIVRYSLELQHREKMLGLMSHHLVVILNLCADLNILQPRTFADAESLLKRTVNVWKVAPKDHEDPIACVMALVKLAQYFKGSGRLRDAEATYREAISLGAEELGGDHPDQTCTMNELAGLYKTAGLFDRAEEQYLDIQARLRRVYGQHDPRLATLANNLADLYMRIGKLDKAERCLVEARTIEETSVGKGTTDYIATLFNLSKVMVLTKRLKAAERIAHDVCELQETVLGEDHLDCSMGLTHISQIWQMQGRYKEAEEALLAAKDLQVAAVTRDSQEVGETFFRLGKLWQEMKQYAAAEGAYTDALQCMKKAVGEDAKPYAKVLHALAVLFEEMGRETQIDEALVGKK